MDEQESLLGEIRETDSGSVKSDPDSNTTGSLKTVTTKVPEVEVHLYRNGKGPIDVFKTSLGGWDQDQLEVRDILYKHGFKCIFAFKPQTGRGVPIRFNPRNGRSILTYRDGSVIYIDGEPMVLLIFVFNFFFLVLFIIYFECYFFLVIWSYSMFDCGKSILC